MRTNDTLTYSIGIRYEGDDQTAPTIRFELPRGQELVQLPPFCLAGSSVDPVELPAPASPLTATSWESLPRQSVTCVLRNEAMGTALNYSFLAQVRSEVPNGTVMDQLTFEVTSDQVTEPATIGPDPVTVSAAATFDLSKNNDASSANAGPLFQSQAACPPPHETEACFRIAYPVTITVPAGGRGTTPLQSPITFVDDVDPEAFYGASTWAAMVASAGSEADAKAAYGPQVSSCGSIGQGSGFRSSLPYSYLSASYATEANATRNSGTISCPTAPRGEPSTITITDADTSAFTVPTTTGSGNALPANKAYVASFELSVAVPMAAIVEFGTTPEGGAMTLATRNEFTDLTARTIDGQPITDANPDNDARNQTIRIQLNGTIDKAFTGIPGVEDNTPSGTFMQGDATNLPGPPGSGRIKDGNTVVMQGQGVYSLLMTSAQGAAGTNTSQTLVTCDVWDGDRLALASHPDWNGSSASAYPGNGRPVFPVLVRHPYYNLPASTIGQDQSGIGSYKVEYSSGPAGPGADADCSTGTWSENPDDVVAPTVDAQGRTVWDGINRVRVTWVATFPAGTTFGETIFRLAVGMVVLDGDHAAPIGNWASQVLADGTRTTDEVFSGTHREQMPTYDPVTHTKNQGDRLWQGDARARIRKLVERVPGSGEFTDAAVPQYTSGSTIRYRLDPSLTGDVTVDGQKQQVTIEDCLPRFQVFDSAAQGAAALNPVVVQMGAPAEAEIACPANQQYLRWDLGELAVGAPIEPIVVTVEILDVARNGTFTNETVIASPADTSPVGVRSDDVQMQLVVPTGLKISKTADPGVIEVNPEGVATPRTLRWSVFFANIDGPPNVGNVDVIDVLPANGLAGNDFQGSLRFDSAAPAAGTTDVTILYTKRPSGELESNPSAASNLADGSTVWCDAPTGGAVVSGESSDPADPAADCPASNEEVTGLRFLRPGEFDPDDDFQVDILMTPVGNHSGDVYRNITSGRADGVTQGVGPARRDVKVVASSIGHLVWEDLDKNGLWDAGEPGVPGIRVVLTGTDKDGNPVSLETTTDGNGEYSFPELASGTYQVQVAPEGLPVNHTFTQQHASSEGVYSDVDVATGLTPEFTLAADTGDLTRNAGIVIDRNVAIAITKELTKQTPLTGEHTTTLTYDVVVTSEGTASGTYDLSDTLRPGEGIVVEGVRVTVPPELEEIQLTPGFDGAGQPVIATQVPIAGGEVHRYVVEVDVRVPVGLTQEQADCELTEGEEGTGFLNEATLTTGEDSSTAEACAPAPVIPGPTPTPTPPDSPSESPSTPVASPTPGPELGSTGAGILGLVAAAGLLLLAGGTTMLLRRRATTR
ncbi:SdrD B-like domain-containing protein [Salana multivorans]|uniref:SdrD B-like domain-containing protein n=1 Tax=Salana multivorans TaxID=120377 RepID=UPI000F4BA157|nr:SdrD B-like domain-containing protein [Salana multivorans]